jgi:cytochrome c-type biogenesis protein
VIVSATPLLTAVWLGILTSISPCPLATNVAAISFIGKDLGAPRKVLLTGLLYTAGRSLAYAVLAALLIASIFAIPDLSFWLSTYMNKLLGPVLIVVGIVLLDVLPFRFATSCVTDQSGQRLGRSGPWGAGLLGVLFALSFCPVSAALFFGSLLPLAAKNGSSVLMPSAYGAGTGLPVFVFAVLIAMGAQWVSKAFKQLVRFEKWARRVTGVIFVLIGVHYCLLYIFGVQIL